MFVQSQGKKMCLINGLQLHLSVVDERGNAHMLTNKANSTASYLRIDMKCKTLGGNWEIFQDFVFQ